MNILTIAGIANYFLRLDISKNTAISIGLFLYISITTINYLLLFRKKDEIFKKCEELPTEIKSRWKLFLWLYGLISIILVLYVITNLVIRKYN